MENYRDYANRVAKIIYKHDAYVDKALIASVIRDRYKTGPNLILQLLRDNKILMSDKAHKNRPYAAYAKHFKMQPKDLEEPGMTVYVPLIRESGFKLIIKLLEKERLEKLAEPQPVPEPVKPIKEKEPMKRKIDQLVKEWKDWQEKEPKQFKKVTTHDGLIVFSVDRGNGNLIIEAPGDRLHTITPADVTDIVLPYLIEYYGVNEAEPQPGLFVAPGTAEKLDTVLDYKYMPAVQLDTVQNDQTLDKIKKLWKENNADELIQTLESILPVGTAITRKDGYKYIDITIIPVPGDLYAPELLKTIKGGDCMGSGITKKHDGTWMIRMVIAEVFENETKNTSN